MKLKNISLLTIAIAMGTTTANAGLLADFYAGATLGVGSISIFADDNNSTDNAQSYGAVVGVDIPFLRIEGEYNYLNEKNMNMNSALLNAYFKIPMTIIHPYIGGGAGIIFKGNIDDSNQNIDTNAAYQGMLGLTFDIPALPIDIDVEGRALYSHNAFKIATEDADLLHYDLRMKIRYVF